MLSCDTCAHQLDEADQFCRTCGRATTVDIELRANPPRPKPVQPVARRSKQHKPISKRWLIAAAAIAVVAAGGLISQHASTRDRATGDPQPTVAEPAQANDAATADSPTTPVSTPGKPREHFVGVAPDGELHRAPTALADWTTPERLVVIVDPLEIAVIDLVQGTTIKWQAPEPLLQEDPIAIDDQVIVIGETTAWARSVTSTSAVWTAVGPADRVRISTKPDRLWLRVRYEKQLPSDAEFLWTEVDLTGTAYRTMFRNRDIYFPTPELVSGIGGDLFKLTDAEINPWRLFSPYGVIIAVGPNDLVTKECDRDFNCQRVWYDPVTSAARSPLYADLANNIDASYGARLSPDGRFVYSSTSDDLTSIRSIASPRSIVLNQCLWNEPIAWTATSELFACSTSGGIEIYDTRDGSLGLVISGTQAAGTTFVFVAAATDQ